MPLGFAQAVVRVGSIDEVRVPPPDGDLDGMEAGEKVGIGEEAGVGVPQDAGVVDPDGPPVLDDVGDHRDRRVRRQGVVVHDSRPERVHAVEEGDLLVGCERLIAQHDHRVAQDRVAHREERPFVG